MDALMEPCVYVLLNASTLPPLDRYPTIVMRFRALHLDRYNSLFKARVPM